MLKIFSTNFQFYSFLNEDDDLNINNTERMLKKIKIVENLIQYSSNNEININNNINNDKKNFFIFLNLYSFLSALKSKNKKIISIAKNNIYFLKETIRIFVDVYYLIKHSYISSMIETHIKDKKQFIINEIKIFFDEFFHDKKNREIILDIEFDKYDGLYSILVEFALYYNNNFYERISKKDINRGELNHLFKDFSNDISYIFCLLKKTIEKECEKKSLDKGKLEKRIKLEI